MSSEGWIKLYRQLTEHDLWLSEPFTRGQAWVDLLMLANHQDGFIRVRGQQVRVKRGQVGWSQQRLAQRWRWSRKKVANFLIELEREGQIEQQKNNVTSIITLVNYEEYQQKEQQKNSKNTGEKIMDKLGVCEEAQLNPLLEKVQKPLKIEQQKEQQLNINTTTDSGNLHNEEEQQTEQQKNSRGTAEEQQRNTNKNDKNEKNDKNTPTPYPSPKGGTPGDTSGEPTCLEDILNRHPRYTRRQYDLIRKYWDMIRFTRKSGKVAVSVIAKEMDYWERFSPEIVEKSLTIHIQRYQTKPEEYTRGIMRRLQKERELKGGSRFEPYRSGNPQRIDPEIQDLSAYDRFVGVN